MSDEVINIVLTCDDKYAQHAAVTIVSVVKNTKRKVHFYVFDCGILPENLERLKQLDVGSNVLEVIRVQKIDVFENYEYPRCYSPAIMYRLAIPKILPHLDKALYLDSDVIAVGDVGLIWDIDLGDKMLAGGDAPAKCRPCYFPDFCKNYFSSGILLMNLKKMAEVSFLKRAIQTLCDIPYLVNLDQDVLYILTQNEEWLALDRTFCRDVTPSIDATAVILHFGHTWNVFERLIRYLPGKYWRFMHMYYDYLNLTPFSDLKDEFARFSVSCRVLIEWLLRRF